MDITSLIGYLSGVLACLLMLGGGIYLRIKSNSVENSAKESTTKIVLINRIHSYTHNYLPVTLATMKITANLAKTVNTVENQRLSRIENKPSLVYRDKYQYQGVFE